MEVKRKFFPREKLTHIILTIGFYDGIHKGHQKILTQLVKDAKRKGGKSCVISFVSHPSEHFSGQPLLLLTTWEEKKKILTGLGIDLLLIDGMNVTMKCFHTLKGLSTENGDDTGIIYGFLKSLAATARRYLPSGIVVVWEGRGSNAYRRGIYEGYKSKRKEKAKDIDWDALQTNS